MSACIYDSKQLPMSDIGSHQCVMSENHDWLFAGGAPAIQKVCEVHLSHGDIESSDNSTMKVKLPGVRGLPTMGHVVSAELLMPVAIVGSMNKMCLFVKLAS